MRGFTLIELLVAMTIFLILAGAAFSLFNQHVSLVTRQQTLSGVNIGLRNAMSQLEMDLSGAGQNLLASVQGATQTFSLGVVIRNNVVGNAAACAPNPADWSYPVASACFDSFTVFNIKPCNLAGGTSAPVLLLDDPLGNAESMGGSPNLWGNDFNPGANLANDASCFSTGDEVLVVQLPNNPQQTVACDNGPFDYCMAVVTLTANAAVSGGRIQLQHNLAGAGSDPLQVLFRPGGGMNFTKASSVNAGFSAGAYIIDLGGGANAITYAVLANPANASDPQLVRCLGATCAGNQQILTDQVIGFKVGAALWNNKLANATDLANYIFDPTRYCSDAIQTSVGPPPTYVDCTVNPPAAYDPYDYTLVRSMRISMIARTAPAADMSLSKFKNGFDNGPYLVQQASVVVDLRNLSNTDTTN
jgi:prepilin-type N-terminal cleavage/methylation domain-containing protein